MVGQPLVSDAGDDVLDGGGQVALHDASCLLVQLNQTGAQLVLGPSHVRAMADRQTHGEIENEVNNE